MLTESAHASFDPHLDIQLPRLGICHDARGQETTSQWDALRARVETVLVASIDLNPGKAAFTEAIRLRPNERILLRHKARVICELPSER